jgi:RHS repeat-associated protein
MIRWWAVIAWLLAAGPAGANVPSAGAFAYDGLGRLLATELRNSANALLDLHASVVPDHFYYHADGGGNVTALLDARQAVVARYAYDPFGNLLGLSGPMAEANPYRFSSKEFHANSGTYYYGFRFYEPGLQRWLNRDPIGEAGGMNLYEFVGNDPLNAVDLWGLEGITNAELLREEGCGINNEFTDSETGETLTGVGVLGRIGRNVCQQGMGSGMGSGLIV